MKLTNPKKADGNTLYIGSLTLKCMTIAPIIMMDRLDPEIKAHSGHQIPKTIIPPAASFNTRMRFLNQSGSP